MAGYALGLIASALWDVPTGAAVVCALAIVVVLVGLIRIAFRATASAGAGRLIGRGNVAFRLPSVVAGIAVLLAGCGPPPGLENQWRSLMDARTRYEMCTARRYRGISVCDTDLAAYRAEQARYADLEAKGTTIGR